MTKYDVLLDPNKHDFTATSNPNLSLIYSIVGHAEAILKLFDLNHYVTLFNSKQEQYQALHLLSSLSRDNEKAMANIDIIFDDLYNYKIQSMVELMVQAEGKKQVEQHLLLRGASLPENVFLTKTKIESVAVKDAGVSSSFILTGVGLLAAIAVVEDLPLDDSEENNNITGLKEDLDLSGTTSSVSITTGNLEGGSIQITTGSGSTKVRDSYAGDTINHTLYFIII